MHPRLALPDYQEDIHGTSSISYLNKLFFSSPAMLENYFSDLHAQTMTYISPDTQVLS